MYDVNQIEEPNTVTAERMNQEAKSRERMRGYSAMIGTPVSPPPTRQTIAVRIGDLAQQVAAVSRDLAEAREGYQRAAIAREQATKRFISITEALFQAIQEHREGTPENVPYQP